MTNKKLNNVLLTLIDKYFNEYYHSALSCYSDTDFTNYEDTSEGDLNDFYDANSSNYIDVKLVIQISDNKYYLCVHCDIFEEPKYMCYEDYEFYFDNKEDYKRWIKEIEEYNQWKTAIEKDPNNEDLKYKKPYVNLNEYDKRDSYIFKEIEPYKTVDEFKQANKCDETIDLDVNASSYYEFLTLLKQYINNDWGDDYGAVDLRPINSILDEEIDRIKEIQDDLNQIEPIKDFMVRFSKLDDANVTDIIDDKIFEDMKNIDDIDNLYDDWSYPAILDFSGQYLDMHLSIDFGNHYTFEAEANIVYTDTNDEDHEFKHKFEFNYYEELACKLHIFLADAIENGSENNYDISKDIEIIRSII